MLNIFTATNNTCHCIHGSCSVSAYCILLNTRTGDLIMKRFYSLSNCSPKKYSNFSLVLMPPLLKLCAHPNKFPFAEFADLAHFNDETLSSGGKHCVKAIEINTIKSTERIISYCSRYK